MSTPLETIAFTFRRVRPALMPYYTLGYPDFPRSLEVISSCAAAGADLMELGIPFSDPLADGPTIQNSSQIALEGGMTTSRSLEGVRQLRARGITIPFILMGYYNPMLAFGLERFVEQAAGSGAQGLIVPDLPPEEASLLEELCNARGLGLSYLISPNSDRERIKLAGGRSTGFTYLVSVMGITGARAALPDHLAGFITRVRAIVDTPLAVGFGISTPEQAGQVGKLADGVIIGSALIKKVEEALRSGADAAQAAGQFVGELKAGINV